MKWVSRTPPFASSTSGNFELIFVAADERDVVRLRTNYRKNKEVYLCTVPTCRRKRHKRCFSPTTYLNKLKNTRVVQRPDEKLYDVAPRQAAFGRRFCRPQPPDL